MTRTQKIWDFLFGVAVIGGAPIVAFCFVALIFSFVFHSADSSPLIGLVVLASGAAAFVAACLWRRKHRHLPSSFFIAELLVAVFAGVLFMLIFVAAGYAAYRAD
jgi:hypothetical protein